MSKFYVNTITLTVLSEEPIVERELGQILEDCDTGDLVLAADSLTPMQVDGRTMANWPHIAHSDPGFFNLDDDGNKVED